MQSKKFILAFLILLAASPVSAEDRSVTKLDEVVVTATRTEKSLDMAPGNVTVVTKSDMEKRNIRTIDEALNALPGVFDRRVNLMDTLSSITLGGIPGQNRTLIMKDGIPINNAYTGDVTLTGMATGDIERIEVVQGPFSSLYGGYAMGGVVNIRTKMPDKREFTVKSGYGTGWSRGESYDDLQSHYLSYGDKPTDKLRIFFSYGYKATNGYAKDLNVQTAKPTAGIAGYTITSDSQGNTRYLIGDKGDNTWWDDNINIRTSYDFSDVSKLHVSYLRTRYRYNYDEPHTYLKNAAGNPVYAYGTVRESSFTGGAGFKEANLYTINYENEFGMIKTKLTLGLNDEAKNWYTTPNTATPYATLSGLNGKVASTPNQSYFADLQFSRPFFDRHLITWGGSYRNDTANSEEYNLTYYKDETSTTTLSYNAGGKTRTYAFFVQDEILLRENLTAYVGFREDFWDTYDGYANQFGAGAFSKTYEKRSADAFNPKLSIVYKPFTTTTLRTSAGQSFRAPTVYELYRTWISTTNVVYNGNSDLKPETVRSWDVGVTQALWKGAKFSATYFENYLTDLIYRKTISATQQDYINAGKADSKGVMIEMEQRFGDWLRLFTNFTYTDAFIRENSAKPTTVDKRLTYLPDKLFNIGAEFTKGPVTLSVTGRYVGKRYTNDENLDIINNVSGSYDPFLTADAKVSYRFAKFATASLCVNNIADERHYESYKAPGRFWYGELTLRF